MLRRVSLRQNGVEALGSEELLRHGWPVWRIIPSQTTRSAAHRVRASMDCFRQFHDSSSYAHDWMAVRGARVHNLKNIDVDIPRHRLVVITGLSVFRKVVAGLRHYLRRGAAALCRVVVGVRPAVSRAMEKPDVDLIDGLSPAISIEQKTTGSNPRSTVGRSQRSTTIAASVREHRRSALSELRQGITSQSLERIVDMVMLCPQDARINVLAPIVRGRKASSRKSWQGCAGAVSPRRGSMAFRSLEEDIKLDRRRNHTIEVVVDRVIVRGGIERRLTESIDMALNLADDIVVINSFDQDDRFFSRRLACVDCGLSMPEMTPAPSRSIPRMGPAPTVRPRAMVDVDPHRRVPDESKSLGMARIAPWARGDRKLVARGAAVAQSGFRH